jgi:hypothetical protein
MTSASESEVGVAAAAVRGEGADELTLMPARIIASSGPLSSSSAAAAAAAPTSANWSKGDASAPGAIAVAVGSGLTVGSGGMMAAAATVAAAAAAAFAESCARTRPTIRDFP